MKLQWLGHSAFKLIESTGVSVVTDPFSESIVGYQMLNVPCDIVTISHGHRDHNNIIDVSGNPAIFDKSGTYEYKGIHIDGIESFHDEVEGAKRGRNIIFNLRLDGVRVCHMGDIGEECSPELIGQIVPCDVLLIPVGGKFTIDAETAKEYIDRIMPAIVIPMHYKTKQSSLDIDRIDSFLKLFSDDMIIESDCDFIEFDRDDFNGDTKILLPKIFTK